MYFSSLCTRTFPKEPSILSKRLHDHTLNPFVSVPANTVITIVTSATRKMRIRQINPGGINDNQSFIYKTFKHFLWEKFEAR